MARRKFKLLVFAVLMTASSCSLTHELDEILCDKSDPDCTNPDASLTGGATSVDGGGGDLQEGGSMNMGGCAGGSCPPAEGCPPLGSVVLEYQNGEEEVTSERIRPHFQVFNNSEQSVELKDLEIRYYFTEEAGNVPSYFCTFAFGLNTGEGCGDLVRGRVTTAAQNNVDYILSLTFEDNPAVVEPNRRSPEIKGVVGLPSSGVFDQSNDYSFSTDDAYLEGYAAWERVTLYCKGRLLAGTEPETDGL